MCKNLVYNATQNRIIPVISARNARFMDSEINGINVDPEITALYEGKNREEGEELATKISVEIMNQISPYVDGYYLMTPFGRTGLIARILKEYGKNDNETAVYGTVRQTV